MKLFQALIVALVTFGSSSGRLAQAAVPDVSGMWKPLSGDDRRRTIKLLKGKITIDAPDLSCALTDLQSPEDELSKSLPSVTASSVCNDESYTLYAKETLTLLRVGQETFLLDATVLLREVNEYSDPKIDDAHTNEPATITVYRKVWTR
jgi:hypothetical protein